jgi:hypothetical protein
MQAAVPNCCASGVLECLEAERPLINANQRLKMDILIWELEGRMADSKDRKIPRELRPAGKQMTESSPNPHGEGKVLQMPVRTDQKRETRGQNIAKTPNTVGGELNPSVGHELQARAGAQPKSKPAQPKRQRKPSEHAPAQDKDIGEKEA